MQEYENKNWEAYTLHKVERNKSGVWVAKMRPKETVTPYYVEKEKEKEVFPR